MKFKNGLSLLVVLAGGMALPAQSADGAKPNILFILSLPQQKEWWYAKGNVHFNKTGSDAQGDAIARAIADAVQKKKKNE